MRGTNVLSCNVRTEEADPEALAPGVNGEEETFVDAEHSPRAGRVGVHEDCVKVIIKVAVESSNIVGAMHPASGDGEIRIGDFACWVGNEPSP